jgi:hypothetical protein
MINPRACARSISCPPPGPCTPICMYGLVARCVEYSVRNIICLRWFQRRPRAGWKSPIRSSVPFGSTLYLAMPDGLAAFGIYNLIAARHRTVKRPRLDDLKRAVPLNIRSWAAAAVNPVLGVRNYELVVNLQSGSAQYKKEKLKSSEHPDEGRPSPDGTAWAPMDPLKDVVTSPNGQAIIS